jgi:hypothetical protein
MAQKKLLFFLILLLLFSFAALAEEGLVFKKEDMNFAEQIARKSRQITMSVIAEKWLELQKMLQSKGAENDQPSFDELLPSNVGLSGHELKIFVSNSMGKELLKHYLIQAKKYKATLVFNGLPGGSWRKLSELVYEITGESEEGVFM